MKNPVAIGLNQLLNTGLERTRSTVRAAFSYGSAASSSYILERIFGRSVASNDDTRTVAGENANFLSNALSVVEKHSNIFSG